MEEELNEELIKLELKQAELNKDKELLNIKANKENYYLRKDSYSEQEKYVKCEYISKIKPYIDNNEIMSICNDGTDLRIGFDSEKSDNLSNKMLNHFCAIVESVNHLPIIKDKIEVVYSEKHMYYFIAISWVTNRFSWKKTEYYENIVMDYLEKHDVYFD